jgi:hypothetical protein
MKLRLWKLEVEVVMRWCPERARARHLLGLEIEDLYVELGVLLPRPWRKP